MADNFTWEESASGIEFASDDVSSVHYQRVKLDLGGDGATVPVVGALPTAPFGNKTLVKKTADFAASATGTAIWTPASGLKFAVVQAIVSFSAAGALTVFDETNDTTNRVFELNGAANGGMAISFAIPVISAVADNILKYTTGTVVAGSLTVFGYEV